MRFPGFEGEWETKKLGDVIEFKAGYAFPSNRMLNERSTYQLIKMSNVYRNELRLDRSPSFWDQVDAKQKEFLLRKGDTVLTLTGTVGKKDFGYSVQIDEDDKYLLNQRLVLLREKEGKSVNGFISQLVSNEKFLSDFFETAKGGTGNQTNVGIESIKNLTFYFPVDSEQRKIARFLALIDLRIQTQNKIIQQLETLIKILREKLFTQKLRLKDDDEAEFPEWGEIKLGEVGELVSGLTYSPNDIKQNGVLVLRSSNVQRRSLIFENNVYVNVNNFNPVLENDILICVRNGSKELIGKNAMISKEYEGYAFGAFMAIYRSKHNKYLFQWFDTKQYKTEIMKNLGATINSINGSDLKKFKVPFPSDLEKEKIAKFLSEIGYKIKLESQILQKLEIQKQYLLRNLFI